MCQLHPARGHPEWAGRGQGVSSVARRAWSPLCRAAPDARSPQAGAGYEALRPPPCPAPACHCLGHQLLETATTLVARASAECRVRPGNCTTYTPLTHSPPDLLHPDTNSGVCPWFQVQSPCDWEFPVFCMLVKGLLSGEGLLGDPA